MATTDTSQWVVRTSSKGLGEYYFNKVTRESVWAKDWNVIVSGQRALDHSGSDDDASADAGKQVRVSIPSTVSLV